MSIRRKEHTMRRLALLLAIAVGTALVAAACLALAACGNEDTTAPAAGATTGETQTSADAMSIQAGSLDPGTYASGALFEPALQLTIDEPGWRALFTPDDDELALEHTDGRFLAFTRVTRVVDPKTNQDVAAPDDLAEWLSRHPALQPTQSAPASVGDASGTRVDASPTEAETNLFWYPSGSMHTAPQVRWRVVVVDVDGTPLTIVFGAPTASFDQGVAKLEPLLAAVQFD
jgi:ABC-type transport system substrate-binding protein